MLTRADARRRWFGIFFLIVAGGMLAWGQTFLRGYLLQHPFTFLVYWLGCFAFTGLAFLIAIIDMMIVRQRTKEEKEKLLSKSFEEVSGKSRNSGRREGNF